MMQGLKRLALGCALPIALVAAVGIAVYYYPYLSARLCWGNKSWTSNEDFVVALFRTEHPEVSGDVVVRREDTGLLRAESGRALIRTAPPRLRYPGVQLWGDRYSGLISMEVPGPTGLRVLFFDSCGKFKGVIQ